jgi:hypothetical protein
MVPQVHSAGVKKRANYEAFALTTVSGISSLLEHRCKKLYFLVWTLQRSVCVSSHVGCATWQPLADAQHYKNAEVCKFLEEHGGRSSV